MDNHIQKYHQKDFIEFKKFESEDISYVIFKDINFRAYMHSVSFYRSDFRGSRFENVTFYKNNLDRSDFLNAIFLNCNFEKVQFGCCQMKNCYFENVRFINNLYRNTSIHSTTFVNCEFPDENFLINMQHCKLVNCTYKGCSFEMSTTDSDIFQKCTFIDTNLATMHAENHTFIECKFSNVCLDSSYYFGYSIANCNMEDVCFLYRGEYIDWRDLNPQDFLHKFEKEHRFNDILNLHIICKTQIEIPSVIEESMAYYANNKYGRMLDITNIMNTLIFYAMYETVDFNTLHNISNILSNFNWEKYNFDERMEIEALQSKFQNALYLSIHSQDYLLGIDSAYISLLTINFENDNLDKCIEMAKQFIDSISNNEYWNLIQQKKGSWVLTFAIPTLILISVLPKIIKNYSDIYFDIKNKKMLSDKLQLQLQQEKLSVKDIKKIEDAMKDGELLIPVGKCINQNIAKDIKSITANI